jgi:hypothetical protein
MERRIIELVEEQKFLEKEITLKRKVVTERKERATTDTSVEKKIDLPVSENILNMYNISAAAYHGGKLKKLIAVN